MVRPNASRIFSSSRGSGSVRVSTVRENDASSAASARACAACCGPPGGPVDDQRDEDRHQHHRHQRDHVLPLGDGEGVERRGEEEVEQQRRRRRRRAAPGRARRRARLTTVARKNSTTSVDSPSTSRPRIPIATAASGSSRPSAHPAARRRAGTALNRRGSRIPRPASAWVTMCTSMCPESWTTRAPMPSTSTRAEPGPPRGAEDELGGVDPAGEVEQRRRARRRRRRCGTRRRRRRRAGAARPAPRPGRRRGRRRAARARRTAPPTGALGDAGGAAQHRLALRAAGQRDDDPLAGLPDVGDLLVGAVALQGDLDLVGQPEQRHLPQRGEVARLEVVGHRRVDLLRGVDVAVGHPAAQRLRGDVDELDLLRRGAPTSSGTVSCWRTPVIRSMTSLSDSRCWMFTVVSTVIPASSRSSTSCQRLALPRAGRVGVRELVDQHDLRGRGRAPRRRPARSAPRRGRSPSGGAATSRPSSSAAVLARPWVSTSPTTTSVPRSARRCASPSMA